MWLQHADITDKDVLEAIEATPRHEFVPKKYVKLAYEDHPLPIGYGQTISQPYIVALMTQLLELKHDDKVLEIGTGSGYQAAILSRLTAEVYSIEIVEELAREAAERLQSLGYDNVLVKWDDGYAGWKEHAPYDAIVVTAAPAHVPQPLVDQLQDGGRLVIPVGSERSTQRLKKIVKHGKEIEVEDVTGVVFVPFTRKGGTNSDDSP